MFFMRIPMLSVISFVLWLEVFSSAMVSVFFFSSRRRHTRCSRDWSSDVCSSDLEVDGAARAHQLLVLRIGSRELELLGGALPQRLVLGRRVGEGRQAVRVGRVLQIGRASCRKECRSRWSPYH